MPQLVRSTAYHRIDSGARVRRSVPRLALLMVFSALAALSSSRESLASNSDLYEYDSQLDAVNLNSKPYGYAEKDVFVRAVDDRLRFFEAALENLAATPATAKDEAKAYAARAKAEIEPLLAKAKASFGRAKSAGSGAWQDAQAESRRDLLALLRAYHAMHGNVK